jgi:adenylate kinase family enzyme
MSRLINLMGGPGTGKSSIAAGLLHQLKKRHISCDAPYEFPKVLAWDENHSAIKDQLYVIANQHRGIVKSWGKVDYIILDSPILLSLVYKNYYDDRNDYPSNLYKESFDKMVLDIHLQYNNLNILLKRGNGVHNEKERYQNLEQSIDLDNRIKNILHFNKLEYIEIEVNDDTVNNILKLL